MSVWRARSSASSISARLGAPPLVQRDFGQALQRQRLADGAADRAVQPRALAQVLARRGQVAAEPLGFAAQRGAEGVAARRAQTLGLGGQRVNRLPPATRSPNRVPV